MAKFKVGDYFDKAFENADFDVADALRGVAYAIEQDVRYTRDLTENQLTEKRARVAEVSIEISEIKEEKKEANAEFAARMKPLSAELEELHAAVKHKSESLRGDVYGIDDQDNHLMYEFNEHGQCINVRPLARGEKQRKIKLNNVG